jgi:hypothetical protein
MKESLGKAALFGRIISLGPDEMLDPAAIGTRVLVDDLIEDLID